MDGALVFYSTHRQGAILKLFYMELLCFSFKFGTILLKKANQ